MFSVYRTAVVYNIIRMKGICLEMLNEGLWEYNRDHQELNNRDHHSTRSYVY